MIASKGDKQARYYYKLTFSPVSPGGPVRPVSPFSPWLIKEVKMKVDQISHYDCIMVLYSGFAYSKLKILVKLSARRQQAQIQSTLAL